MTHQDIPKGDLTQDDLTKDDALDEESALTPAPQDDVVSTLEAENKKLKDDYIRVLADMENLKKRHLRERLEAEKYSTTRLLKDMLNVQDSVLRALGVSLSDSPDPISKALFEGLELIRIELERFLKNQGVTKVEALGSAFDPNLHQVMSEISCEDKPSGEIVEVMQDGYMLHDRLLRPTLVVTAKK